MTVGLGFREYIKEEIEKSLTVEREKRRKEEEKKRNELVDQASSGIFNFNARREKRHEEEHKKINLDKDRNVDQVKIVDI